MSYKRIQRVTNMMIDYQSARLLNYVQDEHEKIRAWNIVLDYFEKAREKNADVTPEIPSDLSQPAKDAVSGMIESINEGIDKFWKMVQKNTRARNGVSNDDDDSTTGQPQVTNGDLWTTNISKVKENESNENYQYTTGQQKIRQMTKMYHGVALLQSERSDEFKRVLSAMKEYGFEMTDEVVESVANKMNVGFICEEDVYEAINICKKKNNGDIRYFFAILNHKIEGWGN